MTTLNSSADAERYGAALLTGRRVRLRGLRDEDLPHLVRWWADPRIGATQMTSVMPTSEAAARELFLRWSDNRASTGGVGFSVETLDAEPGLVGHCVLFGADVIGRSATAAIGLAFKHQGHGYGSDALRVLLRYAFAEMDLHRVGLEVFAFNDRAVAMYERVGFRVEGRRRERVVHDGRRYDEIVMGVLAAEWRAARA